MIALRLRTHWRHGNRRGSESLRTAADILKFFPEVVRPYGIGQSDGMSHVLEGGLFLIFSAELRAIQLARR
jgi:hypothetical protein